MEKDEKVTKDNIVEHMINKQLEYVGKTIEDVREDPNWFTNNTLTKEQYTEWKEYCLKLMSLPALILGSSLQRLSLVIKMRNS